MNVIHEEGDFECNTGMDGKPVQLFQCRCDMVSATEIFYFSSSVPDASGDLCLEAVGKRSN